ncbi:MAG TPA: ATP-binding protein, partial [Candidatus Sulfotelmatobacter sp.]|nr:ATP-binding protein [Candidatus Sulfotelmatobacter sp.]
AQLKLGEGIAGTVAQQRKAMVLGPVPQSKNPNTEVLQEHGVRAYACYPLAVGERLLGTLAFASRQRERFEAEDQEFFETLASYLALARERLRLRKELQGHAAQLEQTVAERTGQLRELVVELEQMSYSMIHDLRAPLRAIQGYAAIIEQEQGERLPPASREMLCQMGLATNRMDQLITDALNYNKAVREELALKPVEVEKLLRGILGSYLELQPARAEVRLEGEFPPVLGNEAGLARCFSNLLNNAVKFVKTGVKPQVRVYAERRREPRGEAPGARAEGPSVEDEWVRIWVEDNGVGIPKEGQENIFQMFHRMHGPEYEGTGIGLALVRKLMERMGGRVGVESEEEKGSRFWLELRAAA